jgi:hypothetical protein
MIELTFDATECGYDQRRILADLEVGAPMRGPYDLISPCTEPFYLSAPQELCNGGKLDQGMKQSPA